MAERRKMVTALELTAEQRAFIAGGGSGPQDQTGRETTSRDGAATRVSQLTRQAEQSTAAAVAPAEPFTSGRLLVPLTTRLQPKTAHLLRRAILQQRLECRLPATVQEIIEVAVSRWLRDHGFWSDE